MLACTIKAEGKTWSDLKEAVEKALQHIDKGCRTGADSSHAGSFSFDITGKALDYSVDYCDHVYCLVCGACATCNLRPCRDGGDHMVTHGLNPKGMNALNVKHE